MADLRGASWSVQSFSGDPGREVEGCLARAFYPDPLFGFFAPHRRREYDLLPDVFRAFMADAAPFGRIWTAVTGGEVPRVIGAAVWLPPGTMPRPWRRELMMQIRLGRLLLRGQHLSIGLRLLSAVDGVHPDEPHWYLAFLGTDPVMQGRGVGSALLQPVLAEADETAVSCYLETQKEENLAFYGRHGFEVQRTVSIPGSPTVWCMSRRPR